MPPRVSMCHNGIRHGDVCQINVATRCPTSSAMPTPLRPTSRSKSTLTPVQRLRLEGRMALGRQYRHIYGWTAQASNNAAPSRFRSTMSTARDITHTGATAVGKHKTLTAAAQHMREFGHGCAADSAGYSSPTVIAWSASSRSRHRSPSDRTCHRAVRQSDLRHSSHRQPLIPRQLGD